ncbi:hypothetical protein MMC07_009181 [Pseudocyphellaria aurata]|nr:hypothetical protein [Pseudocyphellaria aurata]
MNKSNANPLQVPPHIHALLNRLHNLSTAEESTSSTAIAAIRPLRSQDAEAGNVALHNLMIDKFVALDKDKCEFVYQLALAIGAKTIVEVGTSFGVSTVYLALAVGENAPQGGKVIATEIEAKKAARAREHWTEAGEQVSKYIELREGDFRETLKTNLEEVDLVLIDIWVALALPALKILQPKLRSGAVVIVDNTTSLGDLYADLLNYLRDPNGSFTTLTLPYSNGIYDTTVENKAHYNTFRELKQSAESCPLCQLFIEELEKKNGQYDYDQTSDPGNYRGIYYTGKHESNFVRIREADPKFLIGLTMKCQGGFATVDIYASEGMFAQYVTLSHCWGNAVTLQTTTETLPTHKKQISLSRMTKTFRDAVIITRNLGFSYLWIDSLCIIQDDPKDWETESALMADIYSNSAVTIAASSSENSQVGCFFPRDRTPPIALNYPSNTRSVGFVYVRRPLKDFEETVNSGPLNSRAWAFQERLLSRRILHYGKDQLHWECQETYLSEDGHEAFGNQYDKSTSILSSSATSRVERNALYMDWYKMVEDFTKRHLTRESDKFPALSGLVSVFARLTKDRYVAGLWENDLLVGLLWHASYREGPRLQRPPAYRAPSWSWASLDGGISFDSEVNYSAGGIPMHRATLALSDINIAIQLAGSDPFGMVASGTMAVSGRVKQVEYQITSESLEYYYSLMPNMSDSLYSNGKKIGTAFFDEAGTDGSLYCLEVCTSYKNDDEGTTHEQSALVLKSIGANEKYCRVGTASLRPPFGPAEKDDWFYDVPRRNITIF